MIGDDDGVTPALVTLAGWMARAGIDAAQVPVPTYLWPGVTSKLDGAQGGGSSACRATRDGWRSSPRPTHSEVCSQAVGFGSAPCPASTRGWCPAPPSRASAGPPAPASRGRAPTWQMPVS